MKKTRKFSFLRSIILILSLVAVFLFSFLFIYYQFYQKKSLTHFQKQIVIQTYYQIEGFYSLFKKEETAEDIAFLKQELYKAIPDYDDYDDFEKVRIIREWVHSWVDRANIFLDAAVGTHFVKTATISSVYEKFQQDKFSVWCLGTAEILQNVYNSLGFRSRIYSFGFSVIPANHVITLVYVKGQEYIQDADANYEIIDEQGNPLPFREFLGKLQNQKHDFKLYTRQLIKREFVSNVTYENGDCKKLSKKWRCKQVNNIYRGWFEPVVKKELAKLGFENVHPFYALFFPVGRKNEAILREYIKPFTSETKNNKNKTL